jgi:hypothetical protein
MAKKESEELAAAPQTVTPAEFAKIPLDFIIATPLLTTIQAHRAAAETTLDFVDDVLNQKDGMKNVTFKMDTKVTENGEEKTVTREISVPLITLIKVPSLNFDSLSVTFNYNISQVVREVRKNEQQAKLDIGTKGLLKGLLSASLVGSVDHSRSVENTANRGGSLEIKIHVSEAGMPPGLQKIINALVENIEVPTKSQG